MISVNCDILKGRVMRVPMAVASDAAAGRYAPRGPAAQLGSGFDTEWIMEAVAGASAREFESAKSTWLKPW